VDPKSLLILSALLTLGVIIYKRGILDFYGSVIATIMGLIIWFFAGLEWLFLLIVFLFLGHFSTKYKYAYKEGVHISEGNIGRRSTANVLANGLVPTFFAIFWHVNYINDADFFTVPIIACYIAAIATVTGDTLSSEIGVLSKKDPILITTFERVPRGTHGGISLLGEIVGICGTIMIGIAAGVVGLASFEVSIFAAVIGGTIGFHVDSFLGAVFERRRLIGNATVNFLSAMAGSLVGLYIVAWVLL
jgi:uncharacterized protein (TIGR00297 family)